MNYKRVREPSHLEGRLKSGALKLDAQKSSLIGQTFTSLVTTSRSELLPICIGNVRSPTPTPSRFCAVYNDNDHSTSVVLSDSDDAKIGRLVVWNDNHTPQIYNIDKNKIMGAQNPKDVRDVNDKTPDLVGNRKISAFTWQELESVSVPIRRSWRLCGVRNRLTIHAEENKLLEWVCRLLSMVPGSTLSLIWLGR